MKKTKLLSLAAAALLAVSPIGSTSTAQTVQASKKANFKKAYKNHTYITENGSKIHFDKIVKYDAKYGSSDADDSDKPKHSTDLMIYGTFYNNGKKAIKNVAYHLGDMLIYPNTKKYRKYLSSSAKFIKKPTRKTVDKYVMDDWQGRGALSNVIRENTQTWDLFGTVGSVDIGDPSRDDEGDKRYS